MHDFEVSAINWLDKTIKTIIQVLFAAILNNLSYSYICKKKKTIFIFKTAKHISYFVSSSSRTRELTFHIPKQKIGI